MALSKNDIVKKSILVFKKRGFAGTSISEIANDCGILKGSLYHHFKSKEELMKEVLIFLRSYFNEKVFAIAYNEQLSLNKRLERLSRKSEEHFMEGVGGCFMSLIGNESVATNNEFNEIITGFFSDWKNAFVHLYSSFFNQKDSMMMAERAIMMIEGAVLMMRIHNNTDYLTKAQNWLVTEFESINKKVYQ